MSRILIAARRTAAPTFSALTLALLLSVVVLWPSLSCAGEWHSSVGRPIVSVDWQGPSSLPPRFRNHCHYDVNHGAWYCSDHCGLDYQFYFCSPASFGCCRPGYGYCDWQGHLRCAP